MLVPMVILVPKEAVALTAKKLVEENRELSKQIEAATGRDVKALDAKMEAERLRLEQEKLEAASASVQRLAEENKERARHLQSVTGRDVKALSEELERVRVELAGKKATAKAEVADKLKKENEEIRIRKRLAK